MATNPDISFHNNNNILLNNNNNTTNNKNNNDTTNSNNNNTTYEDFPHHLASHYKGREIRQLNQLCGCWDADTILAFY